jgi:hypothetical protein
MLNINLQKFGKAQAILIFYAEFLEDIQ